MSGLNPESRLYATPLIGAWSNYMFHWVPQTSEHVTTRLFAKIEEQDPALFNPELLAEHLGISVLTRILAAKDGGLQACLIPNSGHTFELIVDPEQSPADMRPDFREFRIGHELAHMLFYDWREDRPKYLTIGGRSSAEERFCDSFADGLLGKAAEFRVIDFIGDEGLS